ncbi:MAG: type IV pilus assembly protein PilM [Candidatus Paceibacterota bacterium]
MPATAIDIGTYAVKAITADPGTAPNILRTVEVPNNFGVAMPTDDLQTEQLSELINNTIFENKLPHADVRLSLPETAVSTKVISIPVLTDAELASAIGWQAEQHIPIPKEELSLQYKVLYRPPKSSSSKKTDQQAQMRVLLTGTRKPLVERYITLFTNAGIEPSFLETQMLSILRSLGIGQQEPATMVINLGATNMDIMVVANGEIQFVFTHKGVGNLLTNTLQQTVGLDLQQAEQYKRTYGLSSDQFEGKVRNALLPTINKLTEEIQKALRYFASQAQQNTIQRLVLVGGSAQLLGLVEHLTSALNLEILLAAPFTTATGEVPPQNQLAFSVCMGLLMRET